MLSRPQSGRAVSTGRIPLTEVVHDVLDQFNREKKLLLQSGDLKCSLGRLLC